MNTLVLQSQRTPLPFEFINSCLASVRGWAQAHGYEYRFLGDELFRWLEPQVRTKTQDRILIATDIARLQWLQHCLSEGYERVVWLDADVLILDPPSLQLPATGFAVGRETWVQLDSKGPRLYRKVHNAFLQAVRGDPVLPFYLQSAQRLLLANTGGMPDQFVGPKLLTALHNLVQFEVVEQVNMLPPSVALDLLRGGGGCLDCYLQACTEPPAALNLCSSALANKELDTQQMNKILNLLLDFENCKLTN